MTGLLDTTAEAKQACWRRASARKLGMALKRMLCDLIYPL